MNDEAHFRRCWLTLMATNPRMRKRMIEIECGIEGIRVREQTVLPKKDNKQENADKSKEIVPI